MQTLLSRTTGTLAAPRASISRHIPYHSFAVLPNSLNRSSNIKTDVFRNNRVGMERRTRLLRVTVDGKSSGRPRRKVLSAGLIPSPYVYKKTAPRGTRNEHTHSISAATSPDALAPLFGKKRIAFRIACQFFWVSGCRDVYQAISAQFLIFFLFIIWIIYSTI